MILPLLLFAAQATTPIPPLPKGNTLPLDTSAETGVLAVVDRLFLGLAKRDSAAILAEGRTDAVTIVANENADGTHTIRQRAWAEFAAGVKPGPERYEEYMRNPAVEIDGDIAMVWGRYDFKIDGKLHHCGVDHFGLIRENGAWKISSITWSSRTTGCE
jgi:ketosteroid isomerase-like protein